MPDPGAVRDRLGLPRDRFLALFVGRNVPKKGLDHFLDAHDDDYELVAVTDRPAADDPRARFVPFMPHEALQQLLGAVDAFVLPSVGEGFPVVIQEALAQGLPVVTTEGDGYERYVTPEDVVFVEPSGDAIRAALRRLVHAGSPGGARRARRRVASSELGLDGFVGAYEELYAASCGRIGIDDAPPTTPPRRRRRGFALAPASAAGADDPSAYTDHRTAPDPGRAGSKGRPGRAPPRGVESRVTPEQVQSGVVVIATLPVRRQLVDAVHGRRRKKRPATRSAKALALTARPRPSVRSGVPRPQDPAVPEPMLLAVAAAALATWRGAPRARTETRITSL